MKIQRDNGLSLFIHIPKCGGTSIERMIVNSLLSSELPTHSSADLSLLFGQEKGRQLQHLCLDEFGEFVDLGDVDFVSCLIRNPIDRIISELNWQLSSTYFQPSFSFEEFFSLFEKTEILKMIPGSSRHYWMQGSFLRLNNANARILSNRTKKIKFLIRDLSCISSFVDALSSYYSASMTISKREMSSRKFFAIDSLAPKLQSRLELISELEASSVRSAINGLRNIADVDFVAPSWL